MVNTVLKPLEDLIGQRFSTVTLLGGGCTSRAYRVTTVDGKDLFVKTESPGPGAFAKEVQGLKELAKAGIATPRALYADEKFLILEFIESTQATNASAKSFGEALAKLHRHSDRQFGFYENGFIGATVQQNLPRSEDWGEFYYERRLLFQLRVAEKLGTATTELRTKIMALEKLMDGILTGSTEPPALLHGDLWSGNFLTARDGKTYLIDPATYYGHREAELALCRLFGGFPEGFFAAYEATYPLAAGWQRREKIYQLYHLLNHLNMLGSSYYSQVINALNFYLV